VAIARDDLVIPLYLADLSMISSENRYPLFPIML